MYYRIIRQYSELETQKVKDFSQKTNFYLPIYRLAYSVSETHRLQREIRQFEKVWIRLMLMLLIILLPTLSLLLAKAIIGIIVLCMDMIKIQLHFNIQDGRMEKWLFLRI